MPENKIIILNFETKNVYDLKANFYDLKGENNSGRANKISRTSQFERCPHSQPRVQPACICKFARCRRSCARRVEAGGDVALLDFKAQECDALRLHDGSREVELLDVRVLAALRIFLGVHVWSFDDCPFFLRLKLVRSEKGSVKHNTRIWFHSSTVSRKI
jgi:hypothetical protein